MYPDEPRDDTRIDVRDEVMLAITTDQGMRLIRAQVLRLLPDGLAVTLRAEAQDLTSSSVPYKVLVTRASRRAAIAAEMTRVVQDHPTGLVMTLKQEGQWVSVQRRRDVRLPTVLDAQIEFRDAAGERRSAKVTALDISGGGLQIQARQGLAVGDAVSVTLQIPGQPAPLHAAAEVRRVITPDEIGRDIFRMGLKFVALPQRDEDRVVAFIFKEQAKAKRLTADPRRHV